MQCYESFKNNKSIDYSNQFDKCDNANPHIDPGRNVYDWKQLDAAYDKKYEISNGVQFRAQFTSSVCSSCNPTINNICKSSRYIQYDESGSEHRTKQ